MNIDHIPTSSFRMTLAWRNDMYAPLSTRIARWRAFYAARRAERGTFKACPHYSEARDCHRADCRRAVRCTKA